MTRPGQTTRHGDENAVAKLKQSAQPTGRRVVLGDVSNARPAAPRGPPQHQAQAPTAVPAAASAVAAARRGAPEHPAGPELRADHSPARALKRPAATTLDGRAVKRDRVLQVDESVRTLSSPGLVDPSEHERDAEMGELGSSQADSDAEMAEGLDPAGLASGAGAGAGANLAGASAVASGADYVDAPYMLPADPPRFAGVKLLPRVAVAHDDLDAEDADDPFMVPEYATDIFKLLYRIEARYVPLPSYMTEVQDMRWAVRGVLMNWLITVHAKFRLLPETLMLAGNIVDRYLSVRKTPLSEIQLLGVTSLFIAAKYEEVYSPGISNYAYVSNCESAAICRQERTILSCLEYDLCAPNPLHFLRLASKADDYNIHTRTFAKYLTEIQLVEERLLAYPQSAIAAAAVCLAREILQQGPWDNNLIHYSGGYTMDALLPVMRVITEFLMAPVVHADLDKKYDSKKFLRASAHSRRWAESKGRQWLIDHDLFAH